MSFPIASCFRLLKVSCRANARVLVSGLSSRHRRFLSLRPPFEFVSSKPRAPRPSPESARFLSCRPQTKNKGSLPLVSLTSRLLPHPHVRILDPHRKFVSSAIKAVRLCPFPRITLTNEFTIKRPEQMLPGRVPVDKSFDCSQ